MQVVERVLPRFKVLEFLFWTRHRQAEFSLGIALLCSVGASPLVQPHFPAAEARSFLYVDNSLNWPSGAHLRDLQPSERRQTLLVL